MRVLIIAPHASHKWGGEAILPLHYFNKLTKASVETWMIVHERSRSHIEESVNNRLEFISYIEDSFLHKFLYRIQKILPDRVGSMSFGVLLKLAVQFEQRALAKKVISQHQIDIVHEPIPVSPKTPSALFCLNAPVVIGPMNGGMTFPTGFEKFKSRTEKFFVPIGRLFSHLFNLVIPGKFFADVLLVANPRTAKALPTNRAKKVIELVENGVDLSLFTKKPSSEAQPNSEENEFKFVYVGRLVDWKAVDLLLKAFTQLENENWTLDIIGDGEDKRALEKLSARLSIDGKVNFLGLLSQAEVSEILTHSNCLVLPSIYECGGAVVLEAMASGIPVIATDWGGPADYLDENTGILVNPGGGETEFIRNLTTAMQSAMQDPSKFSIKGEHGRKKVEDVFSWDKKIDQIIEIYQDAITDYRP